MFRSVTKVSIAIILVLACGQLARAVGPIDPVGTQPASVLKATCDFSAGFPKAGSKQGEVVEAIDWANCNGVDRIIGGILKTINGNQPFLVKGFSVEGTQQAPRAASGSYS